MYSNLETRQWSFISLKFQNNTEIIRVIIKVELIKVKDPKILSFLIIKH